LGPIWKQGRLLCALQLQRGARVKCLSCLPLNTPMYITLTMILYENMKLIEHALLHPICVLSHLMCACKHCHVKSSLYYWTHWSCWWVHHFKKHRYHAIFYNNLDTQVGWKNRSGWKKTLSGSPGHMRQNAYSHNLKWTFEDLLPCYRYAIKTKSSTIG